MGGYYAKETTKINLVNFDYDDTLLATVTVERDEDGLRAEERAIVTDVLMPYSKGIKGITYQANGNDMIISGNCEGEKFKIRIASRKIGEYSTFRKLTSKDLPKK